jgi:phosphoribosylformimino-5-aminoimidazole carboxamide ribotide isomerase
MTRFRPCIDLHAGQVKQIVGGTLTTNAEDLKTNYVSALPASHFAKLYKDNGLTGGHVVMLGPGNDEAAKEALRTWPGGLQVAGGITDKNAQYWIDAGAEKVATLSFPSSLLYSMLDASLSPTLTQEIFYSRLL